ARPAGPTPGSLARGAHSPDAVAGGILTDGPVLLASNTGTTLPPVTADAIAALDPDRVIALGGKAAVTSAVLLEAAEGRLNGRITGANRWATPAAIAKRAFPGGNHRAYLARGAD